MIDLANPFPVALEEDLGGGHSLAHQQHGLVLDNVHVLRLYQEVGQQVRVGTRHWVGHCGTLLGTRTTKPGSEDYAQERWPQAGPDGHGRGRTSGLD